MNTKQLGNSDMTLTPLGVGAWAIGGSGWAFGWGPQDDIGAVFGLTALTVAFGSVPKSGRVTDDTAIYQNLSEIKIPKERAANFDADIERLNSLEGRYREKLPSMARLHSPMKRVSGQKYKFRKNQAGAVSQ